MKNKTILLPGYVIAGGLFKTDTKRLKDELALYAGKPITIEIRVFAGDISEAFKAYYYNHIVKEFRKACLSIGERLTDIQSDEFIRDNCPEALNTYYDHEVKRLVRLVYEIKDMSRAQLLDVIAWVKEYAAMNMDYNISDNTAIYDKL